MTLEQWMVLIPVLLSSITGTIVAIITAIRAGQTVQAVQAVHDEVKLPSNGGTAGALLEGISQASTAAALEATRVRQALTEKEVPPTT